MNVKPIYDTNGTIYEIVKLTNLIQYSLMTYLVNN